MKKILLVCNAGMSTSMLVKRMLKAAEEIGVQVEIEAKPLAVAKKEIGEVDIVLLGPINMKDYGIMDGKKVLEHALQAIGG